jgi:hypothetical protein
MSTAPNEETESRSGAGARVIRAQVLVARAALRVSDSHAQLEIAGMAQVGTGRVYEVWREGAGASQPTNALFSVSSSGKATVGVSGGGWGGRERGPSAKAAGACPHAPLSSWRACDEEFPRAHTDHVALVQLASAAALRLAVHEHGLL